MCIACTPILVGVTSLVSEIFLLSKFAKFPFLTMDYSPWSSKNLIKWNRLKKFMQVGIDVYCMYTIFGGRDLSGFRDIGTFKNNQISLSDHGLYIVHGLAHFVRHFSSFCFDCPLFYFIFRRQCLSVILYSGRCW